MVQNTAIGHHLAEEFVSCAHCEPDPRDSFFAFCMFSSNIVCIRSKYRWPPHGPMQVCLLACLLACLLD